MTAPESVPEEAPVWSGCPSQWLNAGTFIACTLTAAGFVVGAVLWGERLIAAAAILPIATAFWSWLRVRTTRIDVTTQRITTTVGVFSRRRWDMELYRVKDTTLHEPFLLRLVALADIQILSSDKSTPHMVIPAIRDAETLRQQIRTHVERMRIVRRVRELDFEA
jgi:uncharacterized membrane protein YdbT with pleckstrin-like domain